MSRDLREYARKTNIQLAVGSVILLFGVGLGLIFLIYGKQAALLGFICLLAAMIPIVLILMFLFLSDWIVKRARRE